MSPEANTTHYLLTIFGKLKPATLAEARQVHNATAGNPDGVAAARSLGDLSHMVYVPTGSDGQAAGELLILDIWNSPEGLNQFFSSPDVQAGGEMIFTEREPVLWMPATGATSYHLPAPKGKNDRFVGLVRGRVHSHEQALAIHQEYIAKRLDGARRNGTLSHDAYFRLAQPGTPESLEFLGVDTWMDGAGMGKSYSTFDYGPYFPKMFDGTPSSSTWQQPAGEWVEW